MDVTDDLMNKEDSNSMQNLQHNIVKIMIILRSQSIEMSHLAILILYDYERDTFWSVI